MPLVSDTGVTDITLLIAKQTPGSPDEARLNGLKFKFDIAHINKGSATSKAKIIPALRSLREELGSSLKRLIMSIQIILRLQFCLCNRRYILKFTCIQIF